MTQRRYVLVEGHGEVDAIGNLLTRMTTRLGDFVPWAKPLRWLNLHQWSSPRSGGVRAGVEHIRNKADASGLLIIRDEDDGCPRELAPKIADEIRGLGAPFPTAYVLLKPEYEVIFLPCLSLLAGRDIDGRPGLEEGARWDGEHWESRRGVKEWLSKRFPKGRNYKPTVDQLAMTRMVDLDVLSAADVPCFGTLERALQFLVTPSASGAYPPPAATPS
ncbi:MAG: DUF4276 family protein [Myxococcota bacterium]|jgi:hypothetical protein|nr:DUF4276 family protein [Myxococcota bacterium]